MNIEEQIFLDDTPYVAPGLVWRNTQTGKGSIEINQIVFSNLFRLFLRYVELMKQVSDFSHVFSPQVELPCLSWDALL